MEKLKRYNKAAIWCAFFVVCISGTLIVRLQFPVVGMFGLAVLYMGMFLCAGHIAFSDALHEIDWNLSKKNQKSILIGTIFLGAFVLFLSWWFSRQNIIQQYDAVVYWEKSVYYSHVLPHSLAESLRTVHAGLAGEYTDVAALPIALCLFFFGRSFTVFCLSVFFVYYLPACLGIAVYIVRLWAKCNSRKAQIHEIIFCFFFVSVNATLFYPLFKGYVDVVGVLLISFLLNLSLRWNVQKISLYKILVFSVFSVTLLLCRRWYAFYIVGFYFSFGINFLIDAFIDSKKWRKIGFLCANMIGIAGLSSGFLLLLSPAIFNTFLGVDYGNAYAAYKTNRFYEDLWNSAQSIGLFYMVLAVVGIVAMLKRKMRRTVVLLSVSCIVACTLFFRIQTMGIHHRYLLIPTVLIFSAFGVLHLLERIAASKKIIWCGGVVALCICNFVVAYTPLSYTIRSKLDFVFTDISYPPPQMKEAETIKQIAAELKELTETTGKTVYICGEGASFSQELVRKSLMPEYTDAVPAVQKNVIVDLRDGFPNAAFFADYIVIQTPYTSGFEEEQLVSKAIWEMVQQSDHYQVLTSYAFAEGEVVVYEKVQEVDYELVETLYAQLIQRYPEQKDFFAPNWFVSLQNISGESATEYLYQIQQDITSQESEDVLLEWDLDGKFDELSFQICSTSQDTVVSVLIDGEEVEQYSLPTGSCENISILIQDADSASVVLESMEGTASWSIFSMQLHEKQ